MIIGMRLAGSSEFSAHPAGLSSAQLRWLGEASLLSRAYLVPHGRLRLELPFGYGVCVTASPFSRQELFCLLCFLWSCRWFGTHPGIHRLTPSCRRYTGYGAFVGSPHPQFFRSSQFAYSLENAIRSPSRSQNGR